VRATTSARSSTGRNFFFSFSMHCEGIFFSQKQHGQKLVCRVILVYETYL
jgi:hypothetical protein